MTGYALLLLPSANRVYADAAVELTLAELEIFGSVLGAPLADLAQATIAGVGYVTFSADRLGPRDLAYLGNASAAYALFERQGSLLSPLELPRLDRFDDDLLTIQKYAGKTNEQFTKLLLNVTLLARSDPEALLDGRLRVLDPLCGRGTTLNQASTSTARTTRHTTGSCARTCSASGSSIGSRRVRCGVSTRWSRGG
jgi:hypothetical protein